MQAVILAAGDGDRLGQLTKDVPKPLLDVGGTPIIHRVLDTLHSAGVDDAIVVLGYRGDQIRRALEERRPDGMRIRFVQNDDFMLGNARSVWAARSAVEGAFLLAMSDHLVQPAIVRSLVDDADGVCRLAVELTSLEDARSDEATRANVDCGMVVDLGKQLRPFNALDTGVFWCTPRVFDVMAPSMRDGEAGAVFATLARRGELAAVDVTGYDWCDIDTAEDLRTAAVIFGPHAVA